MPPKNLPNRDIQRLLRDAWLNIDVRDEELVNPLDWPVDYNDEPEKYITYLMSRPEYFYFVCKELMGIQLFPTQGLVLEELWTKKFPMLICSRGFSKSFSIAIFALLNLLLIPGRKVIIAGSGFRQSKVIFNYIETIWNNAPILRDIASAMGGDYGIRKSTDMYSLYMNKGYVNAIPIGDGCLSSDTLVTYDDCIGYIDRYGNNNIKLTNKKIWNSKCFVISDESYYNGIKPTIRIKTHNGYEICGTYNHKFKVARNGKIEWIKLQDIKKEDYILIDRTERWHSGKSNCTEKEAYALGLMIGDGCWTNDYAMSYATVDEELIDALIDSGLDFNKKTCDGVHYECYGKQKISDWISKWKLIPNCYTLNKTLPEVILNSEKEKMSACIRGLFDTDGHVFVTDAKGGTAISVNFTNTSKELVKQLQYILLHYGIVCTVKSRHRNKKHNRVYELGIYGKNVKIFAEKINFGLKRKRSMLENAVSHKKRWVSINDEVPIDKNIIIKLSRIQKPGLLPEKFCPSKISDRKRIQNDFLEQFLKYVKCPELELISDSNIYFDRISEIQFNISEPTYDMHVPDTHMYSANGFISHNTKIRGQRANLLLIDEFASLNREIFETVLAGFMAVSSNPMEMMKKEARKRIAKEYGIEIEEEDESGKFIENKLIISGTASYSFEHFFEYWQDWHDIICSKGDKKRLQRYLDRKSLDSDKSTDEIFDSLDWKDYSVIRIPFELIPKGFMDDAQISRAKATMHSGTYGCEYGACFSTDSNGFFKRSLIYNCTASPSNDVVIDNNKIVFEGCIVGDQTKKYVFGIDPASEVDNFCISIVEINKTHNRLVYCWTTNAKQHKLEIKAGLTEENHYYNYCARKTRELMRRFPCKRIMLDAQGGGKAMLEAFADKNLLHDGEMPLYQVIDPDKPKDTDMELGLHIIEAVQFANSDWISDANHSLRLDMEKRRLLFPYVDAASLAVASGKDETSGRKRVTDTEDDIIEKSYDTLENCIMEIEETKNELSTIVISKTPTGRYKWDTPEIKQPGGKKGRMKKDRYSALLLANMGARAEDRPEIETFPGGFARHTKEVDGQLYAANPYMNRWAENFYGGV